MKKEKRIAAFIDNIGEELLVAFSKELSELPTWANSEATWTTGQVAELVFGIAESIKRGEYD